MTNMKQKYEFDEPLLYTTGAFVQPMKLIKGNGREVWLWVVTKFDGDTFSDGDVYNPKEYGDTKGELLIAKSQADDGL